MSFNKIIKEGSGKYVWSMYMIMNNFGSFHVVQVSKFQNIKLNPFVPKVEILSALILKLICGII